MNFGWSLFDKKILEMQYLPHRAGIKNFKTIYLLSTGFPSVLQISSYLNVLLSKCLKLLRF